MQPTRRLKTLSKYISWQAFSVVYQAVMQLLVIAVIARFLTPEQLGLYAASLVVITFLQMLAEGGAGAAIVQSQTLEPELIGSAFILSACTGLTFLLIVVGMAPAIAAFFDMPGIQEIVPAMSVMLLLIGMSKIPEGLLQRALKFRALAIVNVTSFSVGYALVTIILAVAGFGVWSMVLGIIAQVLIRILLLVFITRPQLTIRCSREGLKRVFSFGFGLTQIRIWNALIRQTDRALVGRLLGPAPLGSLHMGSQLALLPGQYVGDVLDAVLFPLMSRAKDRKNILGPALSLIITCVFISMSVLGFLLAVNAELIILLICGEKWLGVVPLFQILCIGTGIRSATRICDIANRALGVVYQAANWRFVVLLLTIIAVLFGINWGLEGVAWAVLASNAVGLLLAFYVAISTLKLRRADFALYTRTIVTAIAFFAVSNLLWFQTVKLVQPDPAITLIISVFYNALLSFALAKNVLPQVK